ncbi:MAG: hypothetical protein WDA27_12980 [Actinomycetota bacterium]
MELTIADAGSAPRLFYGPGPRKRAALGGPGKILDPIKLANGNYLRLSVSLYLDDTPDGRRMKVEKSSYQYQLDREGKRWIFRYDYIREAGADPHPQAHVQIHGRLAESGVAHRGLSKIHFPTGRIALEGIIRLLIEEFDVPANQPPETWRPVLAEAEQAFLAVAHRPTSAPGD